MDLVLFDIGGVLVRQDFAALAAVLRQGVDAPTWASWMLASPAARAFERGATSPESFGEAVVAELGAPGVTSERFLAAFDAWVVGPFPGAIELLEEVRRAGPAVGCLSNCNVIHVPRLAAMGLVSPFRPALFSHETGLAKPEPEVFAHAQAVAGVLPGRILFLDDNATNVAAATEAGWEARQVRGPKETRAVLVSAGVLRG